MRVSENINFRMSEFGLGTILFVFSIPENPYFDRAYLAFLKSRFFENNVRVSENINFGMTAFELGTILFVFCMAKNPYLYRAYMAFLRKSIFCE